MTNLPIKYNLTNPTIPDILDMTEVDQPSPDLVVLPDSKQDSNMESFSLIDQPAELSIDPASVCPDDDVTTTTSDDISILEENDGVSVTPDMESDKSGDKKVESVEVEEQVAVSEVSEGDDVEMEEEVPAVEEVVMEEVETGVEPVVELELAPELEEEAPQVTLEDITKEAVPEVKSESPATAPEPAAPEPAAPEPEPAEPEKESEPEKSPDESSESDPGSASDVGIPDVELKPDEESKPEEEPDTTPKTKPLSHVISAAILISTLVLLSSAGEDNLPNRTEAALSSLLLAYLLTYAAVDQELLSVEKLEDWLNTSFNLIVCPFLVSYLGVTVSTCSGVCDLGLMVPTLGALLGVELWVLVEHLEPKSICQGVLGTLGGVVLHNHLKDLGDVKPIVEDEVGQ